MDKQQLSQPKIAVALMAVAIGIFYVANRVQVASDEAYVERVSKQFIGKWDIKFDGEATHGTTECTISFSQDGNSQTACKTNNFGQSYHHKTMAPYQVYPGYIMFLRGKVIDISLGLGPGNLLEPTRASISIKSNDLISVSYPQIRWQEPVTAFGYSGEAEQVSPPYTCEWERIVPGPVKARQTPLP